MPEIKSGVRAILKSLPSVDELLKKFPPEKFNINRPQARATIRSV